MNRLIKKTGARPRNLQHGFTTLEFLVAAIIILLLATASVAIISRVEVWANIAQAKTEIIQIAMAVEMEKYDTGFYTSDLTNLNSKDTPAGINARAWKGPYLERKSFLDPWKIPYGLTSTDSGTIISAKIPYLIISYGPDKLPGGTGLNADIIWHSDYSAFQE